MNKCVNKYKVPNSKNLILLLNLGDIFELMNEMLLNFLLKCCEGAGNT